MAQSPRSRFEPHLLTWILVLLAALLVAFVPIPEGSNAKPAERYFRLQAGQFAYAPAQLHANPGDTVTIELVSTDTIHGLYVDGYGVSVEADPGRTALLTFVADRPGSFRFRCNVTCGALHPFMLGKLTVGSNTNFYRGAGLAVLGALGAALTLRRNTTGRLPE